MSQHDLDAVVAFFAERQRLLFEVIEGTLYDLGEHVEALRDVVALLKVGAIAEAVDLLEHEIASAAALVVALHGGDEDTVPQGASRK